MDEQVWIAGAIAVLSVLEAESRPVAVVLVQRDRLDSTTARVLKLARARGAAVERVAADEISARVSGVGHGGIAAQVGPRRLVALDTLATGPAPALVMLDGIEDPHNFGQAVRALYAAGIDGLVVRPRNWLSTAAMIRASAGASEFMPTAVAESVEAAAIACRASGLRVVVAVDDGEPMHAMALTGPLMLIVGGERRGITRSFVAAADVRVRIPYGRPFPHALGTAGAATVLAFEIMRQRQALGR